MSLKDGTAKMSKSDPLDHSRINLTDSKDLIAQKIKKAKTDLIPQIYYDKERPEISNLLTVYFLFFIFVIIKFKRKEENVSSKIFDL